MLAKEKTLRQWLERIECTALAILERSRNDPTKLAASNLAILLTWHRQSKVANMKNGGKAKCMEDDC
jgi:hypothetical protein